MADFSRPEISRRLAALSSDLEQFPPSLQCPWPLARVFNELLKQTKQELTDDPIVRGIKALELESRDSGPGVSDALTGTVRALVGQLTVALNASGTGKVATAKASSKGAGKSAPAGSRSSAR